MNSISSEQLMLYKSLFRGRDDIYPKHWEKNGRSGYSPAYDLNWNEFMAFKAKGGTMKDFENKKPLSLTQEVIKKHLFGGIRIGVYPLLEDNTSYFIAADFDKENWKEECRAFLSVCEQFDMSAYLERSGSGNGGHVWMFFEEAYPAVKSRKIVFEMLRISQQVSIFEKEVSFDRLFPNQDYHSHQGIGNLIALPLQGRLLKDGNTAFLDPETFKVIPDQWKFLKQMKKLSTVKLNTLHAELSGNKDTQEQSLLSKNESQKKNVVPSQCLNIFIRHQIFLRKSELTGALVHFLREELNFLKTEYLTKKKYGKSVYQTEKYFKLITENENEIMIPRGFVNDLIQFCTEENIAYQIVDERKQLKEISFPKAKIDLYGYQEEALEITEEKDFGVIVAPPGAGKTVMGLELIVRKQQPTLILVHRKQLLDQWIERIQSFLKIPKKDIGQISGSKKKVGKKITVAMMQSFSRMENIDEYKDSFGTITVDECHHIPAKTFREVIVHFNSYYLYGLTATPQRKHNDEKLIFIYIGNILSEVDSITQQQGKEALDPQVRIRKTNLSLPFDSGVDDVQTLLKILTYDSQRNQMIADDVLRQVEQGKKILVLTERKEHVDVLALYIKDKCEVITIVGSDAISAKKSKLEQIKLGHFQVLISTGQFFGEGMDVDHLDCLFLAFPFSYKGKLIQYIGRIQRSDNPQLVFDYRDKKIPYFENMFKQRRRYYKKLKNVNPTLGI